MFQNASQTGALWTFHNPKREGEAEKKGTKTTKQVDIVCWVFFPLINFSATEKIFYVLKRHIVMQITAMNPTRKNYWSENITDTTKRFLLN